MRASGTVDSARYLTGCHSKALRAKTRHSNARSFRAQPLQSASAGRLGRQVRALAVALPFGVDPLGLGTDRRNRYSGVIQMGRRKQCVAHPFAIDGQGQHPVGQARASATQLNQIDKPRKKRNTRKRQYKQISSADLRISVASFSCHSCLSWSLFPVAVRSRVRSYRTLLARGKCQIERLVAA